MKRRSVVIGGLAALLLAPERPTAQQTQSKIPRVGILSVADSERTAALDAFRQALRDLGYVEGRNIILEFRLARGNLSLGPQLAAELVALPVDIIVADGVTADAAAASDRIPIVAVALMDPVQRGFAASLARPGGNITGFTLMHTELNAKRLELLRTAFPYINAVAALVNPQIRAINWLWSRPRRPPALWVWGMSPESKPRAPQPCERCVPPSFLQPMRWSSSRTGCSTITAGTWLRS